MIRSRTLSAGTGRIPARIFSRVSSTVFPSGTRGRATTVMTDWTPRWRSWKASVIRSSSNRTRGSWTSGGSWSAKWVTRSSASQALTSWSVKTASQVGSLQMSLRSWRLCATNLRGFALPLFPRLEDHRPVIGGLIGQREPDRRPAAAARMARTMPTQSSRFCLLVHGTSQSGERGRKGRKRPSPLGEGGESPVRQARGGDVVEPTLGAYGTLPDRSTRTAPARSTSGDRPQ